MKTERKIPQRIKALALRLFLVLLIATLFAPPASAAVQLNISGYFDYIYGGRVLDEPTDGRPESKLWYNDGRWWAIMFNPASETYHIYWLDWKTQTWQDTGTEVDDRRDSRSDVLWDEANNKLYVASHVKQDNPGETNNPANWGELYRFTYHPEDKGYSLDGGFPVPISQDKTKTLVLDKDSSGRLWVTYVSQKISPGPINTNPYQVFVNATEMNGGPEWDDTKWGAPFVLPFPQAADVAQPDISSVITFTDNGGPKIGVMWSNELDGNFYFASRPVSDELDSTGWTLETMPAALNAHPSNDQINLKKDSKGQLFAAIKTHADLLPEQPDAPLIGVVSRDLNGTFAFHPISPVSSGDTRPIVVVHEGAAATGDERLFVFATSNATGGAICYHTAPIVSPLSSISFANRSCGDPGLAGADQILADTAIYSTIDNATTTKQYLNNATDIVILAGDQSEESYVHAAVINPPPVLTSRTPVGPTPYSISNMTVRVTFNRQMDPATVNTNTFKVTNSQGAVPGTVTYSASNRMATFTPTNPLAIDRRYTVTITDGMLDMSGQPLLDSPHDWTFRLVPYNVFIPGLYK